MATTDFRFIGTIIGALRTRAAALPSAAQASIRGFEVGWLLGRKLPRHPLQENKIKIKTSHH
jgi:hypothetical protein